MDTRIFKVIGAYHAIKEDLLARGWVENDWEPRGEKDKFTS
jgi:sulfur transfer complex TusBCD TusB component (DsrH family)